MSELIIRPAEEKDIPAIEEMEKICFASPWSYESLYHDIVENHMALYLVAELSEEGEKKVCGYAGVWNIVGEGHITNVAVSPEYRRRHIASGILTVMEDVLAQEGVTSYTLEVRRGNEPAKALYQRLGFQEAGIRKGYYDDNGEDAIIMWKKKQERK